MILSDCFEDVAPLLRALRHFRHKRHEVLLFHILAPEEIDFPFKKWTQFRDLEVSGNKMLVDPQRLRREYQQNFQTVLQGPARRLRQGAGGLSPDPHGRAGREGAGHLFDAAAEAKVDQG